MTATPADDVPGFVTERPEHCSACFRLIRPGQTYYLNIENMVLCADCALVEEIVRAVLAHAGEYTGVKPESQMEKVLVAVDELTGFLVAVALVRPTKDIRDITKIRSVKKKWKDRSFAAAVDREEIEYACQELGVDLWTEHVPLVLEAMKGIAAELGLDGQAAR